MLEKRQVRLIRKSQREAGNDRPAAAKLADCAPPSEREIKTVVTNWVREHRQRSEEFRLTFTALLKGGEFQLPSR